jgi:hypothetical protein
MGISTDPLPENTKQQDGSENFIANFTTDQLILSCNAFRIENFKSGNYLGMHITKDRMDTSPPTTCCRKVYYY